jgi:lipopolysaccharide transport protein LptA
MLVVAAAAVVLAAPPVPAAAPVFAATQPAPAPNAPEPDVSAPAAPPQTPLPVDVTGADRIEYDAATEEYTFVGADVVVTRGDERLEAPEIHYDGAKRRAIMPRHGAISAPTMGIEADSLTADLGLRHVLAEGHVSGRFLDEGVWATVTAVRLEADDRPGLRRVEAAGDGSAQVVVVRGDEELHGRRIVYDRTTLHGSVEGRAIALRGGDRLEADHIEGDLGTKDGEATGNVVLDRTAAGAHMHGTADRATYSGSADTVVLTGHAVVTRDRDNLAADQITVHLRENRAVADGHSKIIAYPQNTSP